ncbi:unnamed protein product [Dicrocoelium dendriticum]|nr:unnamed protein product [Dicrocoelium dendriticum]
MAYATGFGSICAAESNTMLTDTVLFTSGDKPYTCSACGVSFTQGSSLKLHIKSRHHDNASYFSLTRKPGKNNLTKLWTRVLKKDLPKYNSLLPHSMITVNEMATIRSAIKPELLWSGFHAISSLKHKERHPGEKYFGTFDRLSTATSQLQASSTPKLSSSGDMYTENRTGGEELAPDTTLQPFGSPYGEADFMYNWSQTANLSGLSCSTLIPKHSSDRTWARFRVEQRNTRKIKKRRTLPIALKAIERNVDGENPVNKASNSDILRPQTDATFPVFDSPNSSANTIATCVSDDNHSELRKLDANEQLKPESNEIETEYLQCGLKRAVTTNTVTRECHPFSIAALQTSAEKHFAG